MPFAAYSKMGFDAARAGHVRVAPITLLMQQGQGYGPLDAWYEGFDKAKGFGPYLHGRPLEPTGKH